MIDMIDMIDVLLVENWTRHPINKSQGF